MLAGRLAALAALAAVVGAGGAYVADSNTAAASRQLLQPPLPGPVSPYISEAARLIESEPQSGSVEKLVALAQDILRRAPLSAAPFIIASDVRSAEGNTEKARDLALVALQRDPRNARLQAQLTNDAGRRGDLAEAMDRLSVLMTIDVENGDAYLSSMARVAGVPGGPQLIERELAASPRWGLRLVKLLTSNHPDLAFLARLAARFPEARDEYITRVVRERGARAARDEWVQMLALPDRLKATDTPFNPTFDPDLLAYPPFNWRIHSSSTEISKTAGLYANYEGRGRMVIVEQLLVLPPGKYELSIEGSVSSRPKGGSFAWIIRCNANGPNLIRLPLHDTSYSQAEFRAALTVPPDNCDSQLLRLVGEPAEFTTGATAEIVNVYVNPVPSSLAP